MPIPDFYIPVTFAGKEADSLGDVSATTLTVRDRKVTGVNVKAIPPFKGDTHEATITVTASIVESVALLRIGASWVNLFPFEATNVQKIGSANINYKDEPDCVHPIDVGCADPRPPAQLSQAVTGTLFLVKISNYAPGELVNVVVALCYEPKSTDQIRTPVVKGRSHTRRSRASERSP